MKKQVRQLIILVAVVLAAFAVYFGLRAWNKAHDTSADDEFLSRITVGMDDLLRLSYTESDGTKLEFVKNEGIWTSTNEPELVLDQDMLSEIESIFTALQYQRRLEQAEEMSVYGLDPAVRTVTGIDKKGMACTILLGDEISYQGTCYAAAEGNDTVYVISNELYTATNHGLLDFAKAESFPKWDKGTVKTIQLLKDGKTIEINKLTEKKQEIQQQDSGKVDEKGNPIMENVAVAVEVYRWSLASGRRISGNNETLLAALEELSVLSFAGVVDYRPSEENLASYALEKMLIIECVDGTKTTLWLGAVNDGETSCYARLNDSDLIHLLPVEQLETLLNMTESALRS